MRLKANTVRFGARMWWRTGETRGGAAWRREVKREAHRRDRHNEKAVIAEALAPDTTPPVQPLFYEYSFTGPVCDYPACDCHVEYTPVYPWWHTEAA